MSRRVHLIEHPLIAHNLTILRDRGTGTTMFRRVLREISRLMAFEIFRQLPVEAAAVDTPVESTAGHRLAGNPPALISVLRAGNGLLDGLLDVLPGARVGHVGMVRDEETLEAREYYLNLPNDLPERDVFMLDPMLATGHSSVAAAQRIAAAGPRSLTFACLLAAPEGIAHFHEHHPDVPLYTASIDRGLNENGYIVPGLGDAGDRFFGTD